MKTGEEIVPDWRWGTAEGSRDLDRLLDRRLTFREKLEWLEEAETMTLSFRAQRERRAAGEEAFHPATQTKNSLEQALPVLRKQWSRFGVARAWLFGSRAINPDTAGNDWDFLVEFSHPPDFDAFMGLKAGLGNDLAAHVDLLSLSACTPRFLKAIASDLIDVT